MDDKFSIRDLRARAKSLRAQADEIDELASRVERVMSSQLIAAGFHETLDKSPPASRPVVSQPVRVGGKGKAPGTLSMNWRSNFASIADLAARDEFSLDIVRDVVLERTGKIVKLSALRRQFNTDYIKHGYVVSDTSDRYRLTDKLLNLIGWHETGSSRQENEAPDSDAVGASDAEGGATPSNENQDEFRELLG